MLFVAPLASAETIFKCAGKNGTVLYRNFPCPSESESKVWVRTDAQDSKTATAPSPTGNPVAAQSEPRIETPTPPSVASSPLAAQGEPRIGMTTKEVRAIWGEPTEVTQEEVVQGRVQTWSYGLSRSVQFDHTGRLSVMQP
jgi:hypothetical protein